MALHCKREHPLKVRIDGMGEGKEKKGGRGETMPPPSSPVSLPLPLTDAGISIAVAVNAQLTPSFPPTFCRLGGGGAARKGHLRQMGHYTP